MYKIKKEFLIPFLISIALLFVLFIISLSTGQFWEKITLAVIFVVTAAVGIEAMRREISVTEEGLQIKKFFRTKKFVWAEITNLSVVMIRSKAYFLLTTTRGFYMFTNLLQNHVSLISYLTGKLGEEKVETELKNYLDHPIERVSLIVMTWVALVIIIAVIAVKLITG
jgi:hypothetical protein